MSPGLPATTQDKLAGLAKSTPGLDVLLLFGSRARGDAHAASDWDLGYLGGTGLDVAGLLADVVEVTGSDRIDLVNLATAGGVLRYRAARDGLLLFESRARLAEQFRLDAAAFWCDAQAVLQPGYRAVLEGLGA